MARPAKFNNQVVEQISSLVRAGNPPSVAAGLAGISASTYSSWMSKGRKGEPRFLEFLESVERARDLATADCVARIDRASRDGDTKATMGLLEKTRPELYGKRAVRRRMEEFVREEDSQRRISVLELENKVARILAMRSKGEAIIR